MGESSNRHGWMAFAGMFIAEAVWCGIMINTFTIYANPVIAEWGCSRTEFMLGMTIISCMSSIISMFLFGPLEQRFGIRKLYIVFGAVNTFAVMLLAMAKNLAMLYVACFFIGASEALICNNAYMTGINHWFKKRQGFLNGVCATGQSALGMLMAPILGALIVRAGWRSGFWVSVVLSAIATVVTPLLYRGTPEELGEKPVYADEVEREAQTATDERARVSLWEGPTFKQLLRQPVFYLLVICMFFSGVACYGLYCNLALFAGDYGFQDQVGTIQSVCLFGGTAMMLLMGIIVDKVGATKSVVITMSTIIIAAIILLQPTSTFFLLCLAALLLGMGISVSSVPLNTIIYSSVGNRDFSKKLSLAYGFLRIGTVLAPIFMTFIFDMAGSYYWATIGMIASAVIAMVFAWLTGKVAKRSREAEFSSVATVGDAVQAV